MKKKLIFGIGTALVVAVAFTVAQITAVGGVNVEGYVLTAGNYQEVVSGIGYVDYENNVSVSAQVGGIVESIPVEVGQRIETNAALLEIEDTEALQLYEDYETSLTLTEARLADYLVAYESQQTSINLQKSVFNQEIASTDLSIAQLTETLGKVQQLAAEGYASASELESYQNQIDLLNQTRTTLIARRNALVDPVYTDLELNAAIEAARANVAQQATTLEKYHIKSPMDGIVLETKVDVGELVQPGQQLFKIGQDSRKFVVVDIDEKYASSIQVGDGVNLLLDNGQTVLAEVHRIAPEIDLNTGTIEITVEILENLASFLQNMTVRADFTIVSFTDVVTIPATYLVEDNGLKVFVTNSEGEIVYRNVEVYNATLPTLYITDGLTVGETIYSPEQVDLGTKIELEEQ